MKTLILLMAMAAGGGGFTKHFCQVEITKCITGKRDTIYIKASGNLCVGYADTDTFPKLVDARDRIFADSVCDYKVLKYSLKPFKP